MLFEEDAGDKLMLGPGFQWLSVTVQSFISRPVSAKQEKWVCLAWLFAGWLIWCLTQGDFTGDSDSSVNPETAYCDILMMHFANNVFH